MSAEKTGSKTDTLVKVVLVFVVSLLSFSVGTFVGKQVSDSDHRRLALEGEYKGDRQVASTDTKGEGDAEAKSKVSEKDVESLTEEFVNKEKSAETEQTAEAGEEAKDGKEEKSAATAEAAQEKPAEKVDASGYKTYTRGKTAEAKPEAEKSKEAPAAHPAKAKVADATHEVAEKVAEGEAPSDGKVETRKPSSALPSVASSAIGKYTVQVGSYAEEGEAKTHAADLKGKGWNAFYFPAAVQGRTWYRVSVGLFNNLKSANEFRAQFMKDANTKSAIVQKVIQ